ncbi:hypothetical protein [Aestuariibacter salexigens]|uniref:hypothetical protein n=1 Tax=Aestuariibacter salexigens TaxID=226010 RepID=UPI00041F94B1|nr:hypothetical protein [Aestuariibacter salexigens]
MTEQNNQWQGEERRQLPRHRDILYKTVVGLSVLAWVGLIIALVLFHFARPELSTGVQEYWGVKARQGWDRSLAAGLLWTLRTCLILSLLSIVLRLRRTRRKQDRFGISLVLLSIIVIVSLVTLNVSLGTI